MHKNHALVLVPPPPLRFTLNEWHLNNRHRYEYYCYYHEIKCL